MTRAALRSLAKAGSRHPRITPVCVTKKATIGTPWFPPLSQFSSARLPSWRCCWPGNFSQPEPKAASIPLPAFRGDHALADSRRCCTCRPPSPTRSYCRKDLLPTCLVARHVQAPDAALQAQQALDGLKVDFAVCDDSGKARYVFDLDPSERSAGVSGDQDCEDAEKNRILKSAGIRLDSSQGQSEPMAHTRGIPAQTGAGGLADPWA